MDENDGDEALSWLSRGRGETGDFTRALSAVASLRSSLWRARTLAILGQLRAKQPGPLTAEERAGLSSLQGGEKSDAGT